VTSLAARSGEIWIGTDNGLSLLGQDGWSLFQEHYIGLPGSEIKDVALTADGASWVAVSGKGVTRMTRRAAGGFTFERFGPPELVSPNVQVVAAGSGERDLWVGTDAGLSHYIPRATLPDPPLEEIALYPNPFNPACGQMLRFAELPGSATRGVVVDLTGRVLHRFGRKWSDDAFWDGSTPDGDLAPPGLYIVHVATPQGNLTGQVAILDLPCD
jgi:ligand-binding sensor domain-containing protein